MIVVSDASPLHYLILMWRHRHYATRCAGIFFPFNW